MPAPIAIAADLRSAVDECAALFRDVPEERTARRASPQRWSARQILGHLIDSACNNHRRFIINQTTDTLVIGTYDQEQWVARQRYADVSASELLVLWTAYNTHLARVIEAITPEEFDRPRGSLDDYQFTYIRPKPTGDATLGHVAQDYVAHIRHHLAQVQRVLSE